MTGIDYLRDLETRHLNGEHRLDHPDCYACSKRDESGVEPDPTPRYAVYAVYFESHSNGVVNQEDDGVYVRALTRADAIEKAFALGGRLPESKKPFPGAIFWTVTNVYRATNWALDCE